MKSGTAKSLLDEYNGNAPGFDILRVAFSIIIMAWHSYTVCVSLETSDNVFLQVVLRSILPMFFFLGGFLVAGSALRLRNVFKFFIFRTFRIFPALFVEVLLSAIVLGAIVTTLPIKEYYSHPEFLKYFLNVFGIVQFYLPGVFTSNPGAIVNVNLWTLPPDLHGYAIMLVFMLFGILYDRVLFLMLFVFATACVFYFLPQIGWGIHLGDAGVRIMGELLVYCFFIGVTCYLFADKIPINKKLMACAAVGLLFLAYTPTAIIGVFCACYLCLCLGFVNFGKIPIFRHGDYSYGLYLYSFPIQQTLWFYVPALREPVFLFMTALPLTLLFAIISWHIIEKPILDLRKKIGPTRQSL